MNISRRLAAALTSALLALALPTHAFAADDLASLPLGDPSRAFEFVGGDAGQWLDLAGPAKDDGSRVIELDALAKSLAKADVVLIGEQHTQSAGHDAQAKLLAALVATGRPIALGMEFFESQDDAALAKFVAGESDVETMLLDTGWYDAGGFNFEYYRPLAEIARGAKAPIVGLNVPRSLVRSISREGFDKLSEADRALVGDLGDIDPRHRFAVDTMMGGFSASMPPMFEGMYRGQRSWDAAMALSVLRARAGVAKDRLIVVIVGVGHVGHGLGIPQRLRAADPKLDVRVVVPVTAEKPPADAMLHPGMEAKESATFSRGYGDVAYVLPDEGGAETHPTFGVTLEAKDGVSGLVVKSVEDGSIAARAGIRADDVLVSVNGQAVTALPRARIELGKAGWFERATLGVKRGEATLAIPVLVVPATDGPGKWMKSEAASELLDTFDPASTLAVGHPAKPVDGLPRARLVRFRDQPVRVDIFDASALAQTWELDASGRPVKGLLVSPAADGAVRVEFDRDASGAVTAARRFDANGKRL